MPGLLVDSLNAGPVGLDQAEPGSQEVDPGLHAGSGTQPPEPSPLPVRVALAGSWTRTWARYHMQISQYRRQPCKHLMVNWMALT